MVSNDAGDTVTTVSTDVVDGPLPVTTTVTDSAGAPIARFFEPNQNRQVVTSDQISPAMKAAIVAIEDRRFYQHNGVDWQGTIRALVANSASGDVVQGASTLTQQYVKNYFLYVTAKTETERLKATEQTSARKLKEAQIALQMERALSKEEILTRYLNIVSFGNGAAGIASAARTYFNTTADKLTVPQAAMLAGMVRNITATDPVTKPQAALDRRNVVIGQMLDQQMIDQGQAKAALASPLGVANPLVTQPAGCIGAGDAGFFCKYVQSYLLDAGFTLDQLNRGGYTIKTTLDPNVLAKVKASLNQQVPPGQPNVADVMSVVAPGADKHRVLAMAANRTFGLDAGKLETSYGLPYEPVNLGAGSTYKIFTAATALEKGLGINYVLAVPPSGYASPIYVDGGGRPIPVQNAGNYADHMSLQNALATSPNTAFVKLEEFTGVPDVVDMAVRLGMKSLATTPFVDPNTHRRTDRSIAEVTKAQRQASFTLGVSPTSVLELANVGATLASAGKWCPPSPIESVTGQNGKPVPVKEAAVRAGRRPRPGQHAPHRAEPGRRRRHRGRGGPPGGLEPADGGQDRHDAAAQVGRVRRGGAADGRGGDHLRRLQRAAPALRRRRLTVRVRQRQHLRRQDPGPDLVRRDEAAAGRSAGPAAAADRPPLPGRRPGRPDPRRGREAGERGPRDPAAGGADQLGRHDGQRGRPRHRGRTEPAGPGAARRDGAADGEQRQRARRAGRAR